MASEKQVFARALEPNNALNSHVAAERLEQLDPRIRQQLLFLGFANLTLIQARCFERLVVQNVRCAFVIAETGSGKTLAYLLPAVQRLLGGEAEKRKVLRQRGIPLAAQAFVHFRAHGTRTLVIAPSRELCLQIEGVAKKLLQTTPWATTLALLSGNKKKAEKASIRKGATVLVGTPGRLQDHLDSTSALFAPFLETIVLDEIDRLFDDGFELKVAKIIEAFRALQRTHFADRVELLAAAQARAAPRAVPPLNPTLAQFAPAAAVDAAPESDEDFAETDDITDLAPRTAETAPAADAELVRLSAELERAPSSYTYVVSATGTEAVRRKAEKLLGEPLELISVADVAAANAEQAAVAAAPAEAARSDSWTLPKALKQSVVVLKNAKLRYLLVLALLKVNSRKPNSRAVIFCNACEVVEFLYQLFFAVTWPAAPTSQPRAEPRAKPRARAAARRAETAEDFDVADVLFDQGDADSTEQLDQLFTTERVLGGTKLFRLHARMNATERNETYARICACKGSYVVFASDTAARGMDFPDVGLVVQTEAPVDIADYLHRVGRTARCGKSGVATLFLSSAEQGYAQFLSRQLKGANIAVRSEDQLVGCLLPKSERSVLPDHLRGLRPDSAAGFLLSRISLYVGRQKPLRELGRAAFAAYVKSYRAYHKELRSYFDATELHLGKVAGSLFLRQSPNELKLRDELESAPARPPRTSRGSVRGAKSEKAELSARRQPTSRGAKSEKTPLAARATSRNAPPKRNKEHQTALRTKPRSESRSSERNGERSDETRKLKRPKVIGKRSGKK